MIPLTNSLHIAIFQNKKDRIFRFVVSVGSNLIGPTGTTQTNPFSLDNGFDAKTTTGVTIEFTIVLRRNVYLKFIAAARKETSPWEAFLSTLPSDYSHFPVCYSEEELRLLAGSPFLKQIQKLKDEIRQDYLTITHHLPEFKACSLEEFTNWRHAVSSRFCELYMHGTRTFALVPLLDFAEHAPNQNCCWWFDDEHKGFVMMATSRIDAGSPLKVSYGSKSNGRLLLNYMRINQFSNTNGYNEEDSCDTPVPGTFNFRCH